MCPNEELELCKKNNHCRAADARLKKTDVSTYSVYFIEGSQPLFVKVRHTASQVELASLATPVNKSQTLWELFKPFGKIGSEKYAFFLEGPMEHLD